MRVLALGAACCAIPWKQFKGLTPGKTWLALWVLLDDAKSWLVVRCASFMHEATYPAGGGRLATDLGPIDPNGDARVDWPIGLQVATLGWPARRLNLLPQ